jgi:hypothetical protein
MTKSKIPRTAKIIAIPNRTIHKALSIVLPYCLVELLWYNNVLIAVKASIGMGVEYNVVLYYRLASVFIFLAACSSEDIKCLPTKLNARIQVLVGAICS